VTKLTDRRISYLVRQARTGFRTDSLGQMAARWGVSRRRLNQVLRLARALGGAPLLKTTRRPPEPPLTAQQVAEIELERQRTPRGATKLYQALLRRGVHIPKMKIYRYGHEQGCVVPPLGSSGPAPTCAMSASTPGPSSTATSTERPRAPRTAFFGRTTRVG
jgi:hypothetical protein